MDDDHFGIHLQRVIKVQVYTKSIYDIFVLNMIK